jgi:hypothetical protein
MKPAGKSRSIRLALLESPLPNARSSGNMLQTFYQPRIFVAIYDNIRTHIRTPLQETAREYSTELRGC